MLMIDTRSLRVVHSFTADTPDPLLELSGMPTDTDGEDGSPQRSPRSQSEKRGIVDVAYSELLNVLVSISFAGAPLVWSLSTLNRCKPSKLIDTVRPHNALLASVQCIDYNHRTAATLDKRGMVKLWDIKELRCLQTIQLGSHLDRGGSFSAVDAASNAEIRLKKEQFRKAAVSSAMKSSFGNTGSGTLESIGGGDKTTTDKSNTFVKLIHHYDPPSAKTPLGEHVLYVMDKKRLYALRYNYSQSRVILRNTADDGPILNATWNAIDQCYMTIAPSLTRVWDGDTSAVRDSFQCTTVEECGGTTSGSVHPSGRQLFLGCTDGSVLAKNTSTGITLHTRRQLHTLPFHDDRVVEVTAEEPPQTPYTKVSQLPIRQVLYCAAPRPKGQGSDPSLDVVASLSEDLVIITDGEMKHAFALTAPTTTMTRSLPHYTSDTLEASVHKTNAPSSKHDANVLIYKDATELKKGLENPRCMAFDGEHSHILMVGDTHGCITFFQLGRSQAPCRSGPVGITAFPKATPRAVTCILPIPIAAANDDDNVSDAANSYFVASDDEGAICLFALVRPFPCLAMWKHVGEDKPTTTVRVVNNRDTLGSLHDVVPLRPPTVTCMYYSRERSLLYVGDDAGKITIYNLTDTLAYLAKRLAKKVEPPVAPPLTTVFSGFSAFGDVGDSASLVGGSSMGMSRMGSNTGNDTGNGEETEADTGATFGELCEDINPYITGSMVVVVNRWAAHLDTVTSLNVVQKTTTLSSDLEKISSLFTPSESATKRTKSFFTREQKQLSTQTTLLVSSSLDHCVYGWSVAGSTYLGALEQYGRCVIVPPTVVELVRRITALESLQRVSLLDRRYLKGSTGLPDLDEAITARGSIGDADLFVDPLRIGDPSTNDFLYIASHRELHQRDARIDMLKIKRRGLVRSVGMRCVIDIPHNLRTVGPDTSLSTMAEALLGRAAASLNAALTAHASTFPTLPFIALAAAEGSVAFYNSISRCLAVPLGGRIRGTFGYFTLADKIGTSLYEGARHRSVRRRSSNSATNATTREVYLAGVPIAPSSLDPPQWLAPACVTNPRRLPFKTLVELPLSLQQFLVTLPLSIVEQVVNASEGSRGSFRGEAPRSLMTPSLWDIEDNSVPVRLMSKSNILARSGRPAPVHDPNTVHGAIQKVCSAMQDAEIRAEGRTGGAQIKDAAALDDILNHEKSSDDDNQVTLSIDPSATCEASLNIRADPEKDVVASAKAFIACMVGQHQHRSMSPKKVVPPALLPNKSTVPARHMTPGEQAHRPKHMMELVEEHQRQFVMSKEKSHSRPRGAVPAPSGGAQPLEGFQPMLPSSGADSASLLPDESVVMSMLYKRGGGDEWGAPLSTADKTKDAPSKKKVLFRGNGLLEFPTGTFDLCDISRPELKGQKNSPRSDSEEEAVALRDHVSLPTRSRQKRPQAERQRLPLQMAGDLAIVAVAKYSEVEEERRKKEAAATKRRELRRRNKRYDGALEQMSNVLAIRQVDSDEELELREAIRGELTGAPTQADTHRPKGMKRGGSFTAKSGARMKRLLLHQHNSLHMSSFNASQGLDPSLRVDLDHSVTDIESNSGLLSFPSDEEPLVSSSDESIDPKWFEDPPTFCPALDRVEEKLDAIRVAVGSSKTKSKALSNAGSARNQMVARAVTTLKNGGRGEGHVPSMVVFQSEGASVGAYQSGHSKERLLTNKDASMTARNSSVGLLTPLGLHTSRSDRPMSTSTPPPPLSQISPPTTEDAQTVHHMRALQPRRTLPIGAARAARRETK